MRECLICGIAKRIYIKSKENINSEEIIQSLEKNIDLNIYDRFEDEDFMILKLKENILEENIVHLLEEQTKRFQEYESAFAAAQMRDLVSLMCYNNMLAYFRNCIIAASNPIKTAAMITIY